MNFKFIEYLSANLGLSFEELREMDIAVYRRLDGSYGGMVKALRAVASTVQEHNVRPQSPVGTN